MNRPTRRIALPRLVGALVAGTAAALSTGAVPSARADAPSVRVATAAPLAEADVRALMQRVESAARARDVERLASLLSDDCAIELRTLMGGKEHVTRFTKAEYVEMLTSGYASMRDLQAYDYAMSELQVQLEAGGGATVRAVVHEAAVFPGGVVATRSREVSRVERRGDALVLVAVTATTEAAPANVR